MYNYRIVNESGRVVVIRARTRTVAVRLFCESEGCSSTYVKDHCIIRRLKENQ